MSSLFSRLTTAGRQRSKRFAHTPSPPPPLERFDPATPASSPFTRKSAYSGRQRSKRFAERTEPRPRPLLIRECNVHTTSTTPLPRPCHAPSPPLLSNESNAHLLARPASTKPAPPLTPAVTPSPLLLPNNSDTQSFVLAATVSPALSVLSPPLLVATPSPRLQRPAAKSPTPRPDEPVAARFRQIPHSVLFPALGIPDTRPNTDPRTNRVPNDKPRSTPSVSTPLVRDAWEYCLREYPDRSFVDSLLHIIDHGCDIGFNGPRDVSQTCTNLRSSLEHPTAVSDAIASQLSAGRLAGPFNSPPFANSRISPLGVATRKRSGKLRQIHHLSWPHGTSVNDGIPDSEASITYDMLSKSIDDLRSSGPGSLMIKFDLEAAFRHIPIRHADLPLLGYSWRGSIYYELFLMFGLRSAPYIFNLFSEALHWILQRHIPSWLRHYLDDFLLIFRPNTPPHIVHSALVWLKGLICFLGLSLQDKKTEGPSTCLEMLGLELDSISMEVRLPADKLAYLCELLALWRMKTHCTLRELQELTGYLIFCRQAIPLSRAFIQSLFDFSASFTSPFSRRRLTRAAHRDISWWSGFSAAWNGVHIISPSRPVVNVYTDASGKKGAGGIFGSQWFAIRIPRRYASRDIKFKELFAVVHALLCWGPQLSGLHVHFHIDNTNAFNAIRNLSIRSAPTMHLLRQFLLLCARFDITFTPLWIRSEDNSLADAASRFQFTRLFELAPHLPPKPSPKILSLSTDATPDPAIRRPCTN